MSDVAADVAAVAAFLAADTTDFPKAAFFGICSASLEFPARAASGRTLSRN